MFSIGEDYGPAVDAVLQTGAQITFRLLLRLEDSFIRIFEMSPEERMDLVARIDNGTVVADRFSKGLAERLPEAYQIMRATGAVEGGLALLAKELPKNLRMTTSSVESLWALVRMAEKRSGHVNIATTSARVTYSQGSHAVTFFFKDVGFVHSVYRIHYQ